MAWRGLGLITGSYWEGEKKRSTNTHICCLLCDKNLDKDTLCICLVYGLVGLVDVLHGDGVGELVEHPLLERLQPLVVVAAAHKLLILQGERQKPVSGVSLTSSGGTAQLQRQNCVTSRHKGRS